MEQLPSSGESLGYCQSMRARRRDRTKLRLPAISTLQHWASEPKSSVLLMQSRSDQASKDFTVDLTTLIRDTSLPIIWALRFTSYWQSELPWTHILRILVLQAIALNPQALTDGSHPLTLKQLQEAASEEDWLLVLRRALHGIVRVFIVLDTDIIAHATSHDKYQAARYIESMRQKLTPTYTKIFTSSSTVQQTYVKEHWDSGYCINVQTDEKDTKRAIQHRKQRRTRTRRHGAGQTSGHKSSGWIR